MNSRRTILFVALARFLLLAVTPATVSAEVVGSTYNFGATWFDYTYQVDGVLVEQLKEQGNFQIMVFNITAGDDYEYTYSGYNYDGSVYTDEQNGTVAFQSNQVDFNLDTVDPNNDDTANLLGYQSFLDFDVYPNFHYHHPGAMFFVDPVWSTHVDDWSDSVTDADSEEGVTQVTESAGDGSFSLEISVNIEKIHYDYGNMTGTSAISFSASYDADGVLSTWSVQQINSLQNENATVVYTFLQSFSHILHFPLRK